MSKIVIVAILGFSIYACTNQNAYEMAASHECQEAEKNSLDPNPAECWKAKELDGKTYDEYKREKEEIETEEY